MIERLGEALDTSCITLELNGKKKLDVIRELVSLLYDSGRITDPDLVTTQILERESLATTGIGGGIAIPHCLSEAASETVLAIGRKRSGVKFDAVDRRPVSLVFLMVGPPDAHNDHLRLLSRLARYLHDPGLKGGLLESASPEEVLALFEAREADR